MAWQNGKALLRLSQLLSLAPRPPGLLSARACASHAVLTARACASSHAAPGACDAPSPLLSTAPAARARSSSPAAPPTAPAAAPPSSSAARARRLNHVALAVPDLARAAERWRQLAGDAAVSWPPKPLPDHGVSVVFVELANVKIELLGALLGGGMDAPASPIASFLRKNARGGIHHLCLEVGDAGAALAAVRARGQRTLTDAPSPGAHGNPVGFLHPADFDGCLLEVEGVKEEEEGEGGGD